MAKFVKSVSNTHKRHSDYDGVSWHTQSQKWKSSVSHNSVKYECGYFDNRDAAKARDRKIIALNINKPLQILKRAN